MTLDLHAGERANVLPPQVPGVPSLVDRMVLRHLKTGREVATVLHLREEIDLSAHSAAGRQFLDLEKKETSAASSSGSRSTVRLSGPSGSFPWATA